MALQLLSRRTNDANAYFMKRETPLERLIKNQHSGYPEALIGILFFIYVLIRASVVSITIDEAQTCLAYVPLSVKSIVTYAVPIPNNHILNTLLIKLFSFLFGMNLFTVRLPNVLGFVLYFVSVSCILRTLYPRSLLLRLAGIALLTCNPFFMDFFSLARGYALSCAFIALAVWLALRFLATDRRVLLALSVIAASAAVYASFTALDFYVAFVGLLFIGSWLRRPRSQAMRNAGVIVATTVALAALCYLPLKRMIETNQFVFWGSNGFYSDTVVPLVRASLRYGKWYGEKPADVFAVGFVALVVLTGTAVAYSTRHDPQRFRDPAFLYMLLVGTVAVNVVQFHLAHTPYLDERTALSFYVLSGFALAALGTVFETMPPKTTAWWSSIILAFAIGHFSSAANFKRSYQWWFNQNDKQVLAYVEAEGTRTQRIVTLDCNWLFQPSLNFNIQTMPLQHVELVPFHSGVRPDSKAEFYYAEGTDKQALDSVYTVVSDFGGGRVLMKRQ